MDGLGTGALIAMMMILAVNQVVIKLTNEGLQPVFSAGLRSVIAIPVLLAWMKFRGKHVDFQKGTIWAGVIVGVIFSVEFLALFVALDLSTVSRVSIIFYSMPVWMALVAHFVLPGERLTPTKIVGLSLAFAAVVWAILDRSGPAGAVSIWGDIAALVAAWGWMGVSLAARITPLHRLKPEMQMLWQVLVSAPFLLIAAVFFGPLVRDFQIIHIGLMAYQGIVVAAGTFLAWFWLLSHYKASQIAGFAFLSPVFGVLLGWLWLGEHVTGALVAKLVMVAVGIVLINRPAGRSGV